MPSGEFDEKVTDIFSSIQVSRKQSSISVAKSRIVGLLSDTTPLELLEAIKPPLRHILCHPTTNRFTRAYFDLMTSLIVDFSQVRMNDESGTLMGAILSEVIHLSSVKNKTVRARACELLCHIVSHHSETHFKLDSWEDKIYEYFLSLTRDKIVAVRCEAIKGLAKFANPSDTKCPCVARLLWHLEFDPSSEVRRKVLTLLPLTNETIEKIVSRVSDTNVEVKICVLKILGENLHLKYLKVEERMKILKMGILEPNKSVLVAFRHQLLAGWLRTIDNDVMFLLERLDLVGETDICSKVLETVFSMLPLGGISKLWQEVTGLETTLPPADGILTCSVFTPQNMTAAFAFLWSQLSRFVHGNKDIPPVCMECIIPDPVQYSDYIIKYQECFVSENGAYSTQIRFIFEQILSLLALIDFTNESGRDRTIVSIRSLITNREFHLSLIEPCLRHFSIVCPDVNKRIMNLATAIIAMNVISEGVESGSQAGEFRNVECATQEVVSQGTQECDSLDKSFRSLQITNSLLQQVQIRQPDSHLLSLVEYILIPNLLQQDFALRELALRGLGLAAMTSLEMAHNVIPRFIMVATEALFLDHLTVQMAALSTILDLFLLYGDLALKLMSILEMRNESTEDSPKHSQPGIDPTAEIEPGLNDTLLLPQEQPSMDRDQDRSEPDINRTRQHILALLLRVIQSDSPELQERALIGVCKLFLAHRVRSCNLLGQVLIHSFHPVANSSQSLTDALFVFFYTFTSRCEENCVLLVESLIPTLWTIFEAPSDNFLSLVSLDSVCDKISFFTSQRNSHNLLVEPLLTLCLQNLDNDTMCRVGLRCLSQLDLSFFTGETPVISHWGQLANHIAENKLIPINGAYLEAFQNKIKVSYPDYVAVKLSQTPKTVSKALKSTVKKGYGRSTKVDRTQKTPIIATPSTPRTKSSRHKKDINYAINFSSSDEDS